MLVDYIQRRGIRQLRGRVARCGQREARPLLRQRVSTPPLAIIDKRRPEPNVAEVMNIIGDVEGKNIFIFDDMIDTAGTLWAPRRP